MCDEILGQEEKAWDIGAALKTMKEYEDAPRWKCTGIHRRNMKIAVKKVRDYIMHNRDQYTEADVNRKAIFCIYSLYRFTERREFAIWCTVGLNHIFKAPLPNEEFFKIIDVAENRTPYRFRNKTIIDFCDIRNPEEYRIGVRYFRKVRSERRAERRHQDEIKEREIIGIIEEISDCRMTYKGMLDELHDRGYKIGETKLKELIKSEGIIWQKKKKELKEADNDFEKEL